MKVTSSGGDTALSKLIQAVEEAEMQKVSMSGYADKIVACFVPFILLIAIATWAVWITIAYVYLNQFESISDHYE